MTDTFNRLSLLALLALSACASPHPQNQEVDRSPPAIGSSAVQRILVTFTDRSINRLPLAEAPGMYRRRGHYQSTNWSRQIATRLAAEYHLRPVTEWPIATLGVHCVVYELSPEQRIEEVVKAIGHDQRVDSVQRMNVFHMLTDPYYRLQKGLQSMQVEPVHRWVTGRGVTIALIDTGVDIDHPDLQGQVTAHRDFVISDSAGFNDDWHGTAVAGVMAALAHNAIGIVGIAPEAKLIALKACSAIEPDSLPAVCDSLSLAQAIDTAIRLQPDILNLSLTGPADPLLERLIDLATAQGIVVVTAQSEQPGRDVGFPASMENVIGVRRSGQSERGKPGAETSVAAPGSEVLTTCPRGTYHFVSGSSLAAAHVSGIVALMLELKPKLTASAIVEVLRAAVDRGTALSDPGRSDVINVCAAIEILRGRPTCDRLTRQNTAPPETHSNPETKLFSSGFEYTTLAARTPIAINQRH